MFFRFVEVVLLFPAMLVVLWSGGGLIEMILAGATL
jgi:hypothetical protein